MQEGMMQSILQRRSKVVIILFIISDLSVCNVECYSASLVFGGFQGVGADGNSGDGQTAVLIDIQALIAAATHQFRVSGTSVVLQSVRYLFLGDSVFVHIYVR